MKVLAVCISLCLVGCGEDDHTKLLNETKSAFSNYIRSLPLQQTTSSKFTVLENRFWEIKSHLPVEESWELSIAYETAKAYLYRKATKDFMVEKDDTNLTIQDWNEAARILETTYR